MAKFTASHLDADEPTARRPSLRQVMSELGGIGREDLRRRSAVPMREGASSSEDGVDAWAKALQTEGCVVVTQHVAEAVCDAWASEVRRQLARFDLDQKASSEFAQVEEHVLEGGARLRVRRSQSARGEYDAGFIDCFEPQLAIPSLAVFKNDALIRQIVERCVGGPVSLRDTHFYRTHGLQHPRGWHMDVWQRTSFKAFLYLTDVPTLEFGPYSYVPGSHRPSIDRYLAFASNSMQGMPAGDILQHRKNESGRPFLGAKGTLIITNQRGYHRGHPQQPERERILLVNHYGEQAELAHQPPRTPLSRAG